MSGMRQLEQEIRERNVPEVSETVRRQIGTNLQEYEKNLKMFKVNDLDKELKAVRNSYEIPKDRADCLRVLVGLIEKEITGRELEQVE